MVSRLVQHLVAIQPPLTLPEIPEPQPAKGESCYGVFAFDPGSIDGWKPQHIEDAPSAIDADDCELLGRFEAIRDALNWVRCFNAPRLADWKHADKWAGLISIDGPMESAGFEGGLSVSPLSYVVAHCYPARDWRPKSLWDVPAGMWIDEQSPTRMKPHANAVEAILTAQRSNMRYRRGKANSGQWAVVVAIEADPVHEIGLLQWNGRNGFAQFTATIQRRMHVVDRRWPGVAEALKGGGA